MRGAECAVRGARSARCGTVGDQALVPNRAAWVTMAGTVTNSREAS